MIAAPHESRCEAGVGRQFRGMDGPYPGSEPQ